VTADVWNPHSDAQHVCVRRGTLGRFPFFSKHLTRMCACSCVQVACNLTRAQHGQTPQSSTLSKQVWRSGGRSHGACIGAPSSRHSFTGLCRFLTYRTCRWSAMLRVCNVGTWLWITLNTCLLMFGSRHAALGVHHAEALRAGYQAWCRAAMPPTRRASQGGGSGCTRLAGL
jgi:hypothetical protein